MWHRAKARAKRKNVPFAITVDAIVIPTICPVLGEPLQIGDHDWAPSLDRIDPAKGYTPGNVIVVSNKANRIKSDATPDELRRVAAYFSNLKPAQFGAKE